MACSLQSRNDHAQHLAENVQPLDLSPAQYISAFPFISDDWYRELHSPPRTRCPAQFVLNDSGAPGGQTRRLA